MLKNRKQQSVLGAILVSLSPNDDHEIFSPLEIDRLKLTNKGS
jgi:hypothetical protein